MVMIWPYSMGGSFMPAKTPFGLLESSAAYTCLPSGGDPHWIIYRGPRKV
jgi:hypothetical protein